MARLRKVHVANGVSWVEAPEAGLYVLCGCPADAVKHLMRRGLIVQTEVDGVPHETGPNAILLSDVMLQNGTFCNLAEFPVLQMLYRQGMMLPDHPNNTGEKPVLIGLRDQVEAQLHYIYRGNYGLVNREEVLAAGADDALADELMALKLKFAFGRIRHPKDLLDVVHLGSEPVALKGGVTLRRLALNLFEFRLGDETVTVDLGLAPGEVYDPPYPLGAHRVDREYFAVIHSGEGDGWDPNRPSMGSVVMFQGRIYLIDAGPNVQHSLTALGIGINEIDGLFHTHCHDDHFAGLTSLLRSDKRIKYYATPLVRASVTKKLAALLSIEEDTFHDCFDVRDLVWDEWNDIDGLEVKPILSPHPVETSIFIFRALWEDGYRSYGHFADIVSLDVLAQMVADGDQPGISRRFYEKVADDYATVVDLKKLDVGGGLIHGHAEDFREDLSRKIVLAHTARPFSAAEKVIGSGAPFGTVDVLIPGNHDYVWRSAYESLRTYFPETPHHELRVLLNSPMVVCNPETILVKEGADVDCIHLVITGTVEMIESGQAVTGLLSHGAMVGEVAGIEGSPARKTYRAASFVQALRISAGLYREFVRRNGLLIDVMALEERRDFLRSTWVCAESLTEMTLNRLAKDMRLMSFEAGALVDLGGNLGFIRSGQADLFVGGDLMESLGPGDFFGEEVAVFNTPALFRVRAREKLDVYVVSADAVRDVPVMRWKLLEIYERRMHACVMETGRSELLEARWHDEFSVNIQRIDNHHKNLFVRANTLFSAIKNGCTEQDIAEAYGFLVDYARYHFREEELLMERYGYPGLDAHKEKHRYLIEQAEALRGQLCTAPEIVSQDAATLLKNWVISHILTEDRKYAAFLNGRGVY